jgi:hypothetical protein
MVEKKTTKKTKNDSRNKIVEKKISKKEDIDSKMIEKHIEDKIKCKIKESVQCNGTGGCAYFLGFLGALIYYVTTAPSFWDAVIGFFKAIVWPAFLVYGLLLFIGA